MIQCLCLCTSLSNAQPLEIDSADWPTFAGNFQRTGHSLLEGPNSTVVMQTIPLALNNAGTEIMPPVHVVAGTEQTVYVQSGNVLTANQWQMNQTTGEFTITSLWQYDTLDTMTTSPTIAPDGSLYLGDETGTLYTLNPDGLLAWTHDTGSPVCSSPTLNENGTLSFGDMSGRVHALDPAGNVLWIFQTSSPKQNPTGIITSQAITHGGLIMTSALYDPNLYALDPDQGTPVWTHTFEPETWPCSTPVISNNNQVYQILTNGELYAIDALTGATCWSLDLWALTPHHEANVHAPVIWPSPVLDPNGTLYVALGGPEVYAVAPNGTLKWITTVGTLQTPCLTIDAMGDLYVTGCPALQTYPDTWLHHQWDLSRIEPSGNVTPLWPEFDDAVKRYQNFGRPILVGHQALLFVGQARHQGYGPASINTLFLVSPARDNTTPEDQDDDTIPPDTIPSTPR